METMVHTTACVLARPTSSEPPFTLYPKNAGIVAIRNANTAVLNNAYQSSVLYAEDDLNVTNQVLEVMNNRYKASLEAANKAKK